MCVCGCVSPSIRSQRLFKSCASARWRTAAAGIPVELQQGGVTMPLSEAAFLQYQTRLNSARRDRDTRVQAYTVAGVKCCLAGLGEGCNRLTFPASYEVRAALAASTWVREATEAERAEDSRWWRFLEFVPRTIVHSNGALATDDEPVGLEGTTIEVLAQAREEVIEEKPPNVDLAKVSTPRSDGDAST